MDLSAFKVEKNKLNQVLEKHSRAMLVSEFKNFFDANPDVVALRWTQYTPHFNDGDVCEFGRHEFQVSGRFADQVDSEDANDDPEDFYDNYYLKKNSLIRNSLVKLEKVFAGTDDVFEAAFGDGVQVTCTRKGFEVEDYDHD